MKKVNVFILVDKFDYHGSYINGPMRNYSWLVQRINKNKFNVHLYALRKRGQSSNIFREEGIEVQYLGLGKFNPFTLPILIRLLIKHKIDIIHLQGYGSFVFGQLAAILLQKPAIIKEEWVDPNFGSIHGYLEWFLGKYAKKVIAISNYAKKFLVEKKKIPESKIELISNGIPLADFYKTTEIQAKKIRKSLHISDSEIAIGTVGMLHENKGHLFLIEAASMLIPENPNLKFLIIGDGELRKKLEDHVKRLALQKNVVFLGHRNDIPKLLKVLDIFVLTSISETYPTSLIEAMAAARPIITTNSGGPSEIITNKETGIIIPAADPFALSNALQELIDNREKRKHLGINALKASRKFNVDRTVLNTERLYMECIKKSSRN